MDNRLSNTPKTQTTQYKAMPFWRSNGAPSQCHPHALTTRLWSP